MNIFTKTYNTLFGVNKTENRVDGNAFLRHGGRSMPSTWTTPTISDQDFYTGYGFAVINKRANRSVVLGKKFLFTDAKEDMITEANKNGEQIVHPYLDIIRSSIDFSERDFWYDISTYLDLEGVYYLMAVRNVSNGRVGNIQSFQLLNPYKVKPVVDSKGNLGGYVERRGDFEREIPKEMIIPIRLLNPFEPEKAWSLADAARDSQFTLKQANDFARNAIDGNLNAPGIISSAIELPDDQFDNFVSRIKNHGRGEPLFGNGAGTVTWVDMQADLDKAALDKINSINRDTLLAISGLSKTGVGVEESGTGREVSRTQKDDFTENAIMPQIENIIDALNLDYRRYYETQWRRNKYTIRLDNPLETNKDAEQADVNIRDSQFTLMRQLVSAGYRQDVASKFARGLIDITDLGEPEVVEPEEPEVEEAAEDPTDTPDEEQNNSIQYEGYPIPVLQYLQDHADYVESATENGSVITSNKEVKTVRIKSIQSHGDTIVATTDSGFITLGRFKELADQEAILSKLNKRYTNQPVAVKKKISSTLELINNMFDAQEQIDSNTHDLLMSAQASEEQIYQWYKEQVVQGNPNPHPSELEEFINSLTMPFAVYFTVMFPIYAAGRIEQSAKDLNINDPLPATAFTEEVRNRITEFARREATSHVNTIIKDLIKAWQETSGTQEERFEQFEIAFNDIRRRRSTLIADNAAARIYSLSSYEADMQLLTRADMIDNVYKELYNMANDPCDICADLIARGPIPFTQDFASLGETIHAGDLKMTFDYEAIEAGNIHVSCRCMYRLIVIE